MKTMSLSLYSEKNPGVITQYDAVGIECCKTEASGGIVYLASGGCVVAECLVCEKLWRFFNLPTYGIGPLISATENPNQLGAGPHYAGSWPAPSTSMGITCSS